MTEGEPVLSAEEVEAIKRDLMQFFAEVEAEVGRARRKFPGGDNLTTIALFEEAGEVAKAVLEGARVEVRQEAVQLAAMCVRLVLDGDASTSAYRAAQHGLGPIVVEQQP